MLPFRDSFYEEETDLDETLQRICISHERYSRVDNYTVRKIRAHQNTQRSGIIKAVDGYDE